MRLVPRHGSYMCALFAQEHSRTECCVPADTQVAFSCMDSAANGWHGGLLFCVRRAVFVGNSPSTAFLYKRLQLWLRLVFVPLFIRSMGQAEQLRMFGRAAIWHSALRVHASCFARCQTRRTPPTWIASNALQPHCPPRFSGSQRCQGVRGIREWADAHHDVQHNRQRYLRDRYAPPVHSPKLSTIVAMASVRPVCSSPPGAFV